MRFFAALLALLRCPKFITAWSAYKFRPQRFVLLTLSRAASVRNLTQNDRGTDCHADKSARNDGGGGGLLRRFAPRNDKL